MATRIHPVPCQQATLMINAQRGVPVTIRHIRPDDDRLLVDLFHHLSEQTRRMRFFTPVPDLPDKIIWREAHRLADINPLQAAALIALVEEQGQQHAVAVARLAVDPHDATEAEPAIVVRDDYQREGIGTVLFDLLVQVAMVRGIKHFRAITLAENTAVQRMVQKLGLPLRTEVRRGEATTIITLLE